MEEIGRKGRKGEKSRMISGENSHIEFPSISSQQRIEIVTRLVEKPFEVLSSTVQTILRYFELPAPMSWTYVVDPKSGLTVLEAKEDFEALKKIRAKADLLLK